MTGKVALINGLLFVVYVSAGVGGLYSLSVAYWSRRRACEARRRDLYWVAGAIARHRSTGRG